MRVLMVGTSHHTAGVEFRERLALDTEGQRALVEHFRKAFPRAELVVLSTCNRTELYIAKPSHGPPTAEEVRTHLAICRGLESAGVAAATVHREQEQALGHLFRVCSGLDSMVLGEPQIIGQVRRAYETSCEQQSVGPVLHKVFQDALAIGKTVRSQTGIDAGRVSVGSIAVDFAQQVFERFDDKTVVALGAGEMAKLTLRHLVPHKPRRLWLCNRTLERAQALAQLLGITPEQGGARPLDAMDQLLVEADVLITNALSAQPIVTEARLSPLLRQRRGRPLVIIDIAVPRNVAAGVGSLRNIYLYNLDDLQRVVDETGSSRQQHVDRAEAMVRDAIAKCLHQVQHRDVGQLIKNLRQRLHDVGMAEQERTLRKLAGAPPEQAGDLVREHTHRVINKILHMPISALDQEKGDVPLGFYAAALRRLFDLDDREDSQALDAEIADTNDPSNAHENK
ncbi:MAG: glutamyl-tRNA reductase [Phycisphaera sp.]|nr:glutamyl-tRNA reductase [Phycisphaera sp.]